MPVRRAIAAFKTERLNCAQSILRAFQPEREIPEDVIRRAGRLGRGRAEGGCCGALDAALRLAGEDGLRAQVRKAFVAKAGSEQCREIRRSKALSCEQCVELAATLLTSSPSRFSPATPGSISGEPA